ncbi:MAG: bifunctional DNA-formamidopyrimidine glycosylase/DNA-(apurinic or apyrimidinic site) lyase [Parvularculaceae bacterium]
MPELPEVETVRRGLEPAMVGAVITGAIARRPDLRFPLPPEFERRLKGAEVLSLRRRAKYLLCELSTGETLIMHLGMSGRFTVKGARPGRFQADCGADPRHDHVSFVVSGPMGKATIDYNDPRRFGFMDLAPTAELATSLHLVGLGPEPLDEKFTAEILEASLKGKAAPAKSALLDQRIVAGLGNIYVCEALFRAGISPRRKAGTIGGLRAARLHGAIRQVLEEAIEAGGSSLKDFAASDGSLGYFQHSFKVYDREGRPCPACGASIKRYNQAGRSTFACSNCQR